MATATATHRTTAAAFDRDDDDDDDDDVGSKARGMCSTDESTAKPV